MPEVDQVDDCRRYGKLWEELLWARLLIVPVQATVVWLMAQAVSGGNPVVIILIPPFLLALTASSALAKQGWRLPLFAAAAAFGGGVVGTIVGGSAYPETGAMITVAGAGAGMGLVEGLAEKQRAIALSGALGGALSGALAFFVPKSVLGVAYLRLDYLVAAFAILNVGIALSLALGRYISDELKNEQDKTEPTQ